MSSFDSRELMDPLAGVLKSVRNKGVRLWSENGQLRYRAPKGALTQEDIESLRASRDQIMAFLERTAGTETAESSLKARRRGLHRAPLAFSQVAYWNLHQLGKQRSIRAIASATRIRGALNLAVLRKCIAEMVCRHDALRTRIVVLDGEPIQEISESCDCEFKVVDLTELPEDLREFEVKELIDQLILEPIDIAVAPLFAVHLLALRGDEHVLVLAMEHMISDMFSMNVLLRDLFTAYMQAVNGHAFSLPVIPIQFADYAVWQRNAQRLWIEKHGAYWEERLSGCHRLRFPEDESLQTATRVGWGTVAVKIRRNLKAELREWCRVRRTTLVMSVFTAYVGLVLRWCNASESVIQYQSDSRVSPDIENAIGFFASRLYPRIALLKEDSFVDLMNRVREEYCQAYEHADFSYMAAQVPQPEFTRNTVFNWVPIESNIDHASSEGPEGAITCSPLPFVHPMLNKLELDHEPGILLQDIADEVVGYVYFPRGRFSIDTMERFADNLVVFIGALLRQPEKRVKDIPLS